MKALAEAPDYVHAIWLYFRTGWYPSDTSANPPGQVNTADQLTLIVPGGRSYSLDQWSLRNRVSGHINRCLVIVPDQDRLSVDELRTGPLSIRISGKDIWIPEYVWMVAATQRGFHYVILNDPWDRWLCGTIPAPLPQQTGTSHGLLLTPDVKPEQPLPTARPTTNIDPTRATVTQTWLLAETAGCSGQSTDLPKDLRMYLDGDGGMAFPAANEDETKLGHEVCLGFTTAFSQMTLNAFRGRGKLVEIDGTGYWHPYRFLLITRASNGPDFVEWDSYWPTTTHLSKNANQGVPWAWLTVTYGDTPPEP